VSPTGKTGSTPTTPLSKLSPCCAEVRETKRNPNLLRSVRLAKAPAEITDEMVRNLIRYDADRRRTTKIRVDRWIEDHNVVTQADLSADMKGFATRVRLDLNRSKYGTEIKQKGTTFLSIWSERHYPLAARVGTNTFEVSHDHESNFPKVAVSRSSAMLTLASAGPTLVSAEEGWATLEGSSTIRMRYTGHQTKRDAQVLKEIKAREEKEKKENDRQLELRAKELEKQAQEDDEQARVRVANGTAATKKSHKRAKSRGPPANPTRASTRARAQTILFDPSSSS
jgi:hypothetical protein